VKDQRVSKGFIAVLVVALVLICGCSSTNVDCCIIENYLGRGIVENTGETTEKIVFNPELEGTVAFTIIERWVEIKKNVREPVYILAAVKDSGEIFEFPTLFSRERGYKSERLLGYLDGKLYVYHDSINSFGSLYSVDLTKGDGNYQAELLVESLNPAGTGFYTSAIIDSVLYYSLYTNRQSTYADMHTVIKRYDLKNGSFLPDIKTSFSWGLDFEINEIFDTTFKGCIVYSIRSQGTSPNGEYRYLVKAIGPTWLSQAIALAKVYCGNFSIKNFDQENMELTIKIPYTSYCLDFSKEKYYFLGYYQEAGVSHAVLHEFNKGEIAIIADFTNPDPDYYWGGAIGIGPCYKEGVFYTYANNIYFYDGIGSELVYTIKDKPFEDISGVYLIAPDILRIVYYSEYVWEGYYEVTFNYNLVTKTTKKVKTEEFISWFVVE